MDFRLQSFKTRVEISTFCFIFAYCLQASVCTNLIIYRTCYVNLGYNESECALLGTGKGDAFTDKLEKIVEPDANSIGLYLQLPAGVISAFVALFIASWSDRNGRKPVLIGTLMAQVLSFVAVIVFCLLPYISSWYLFIPMVPVALGGGFAAMLTTSLSYITDVTEEQARGVRLGIFEAVFSLGSLSGTFLSSYIFKFIGYIGVYSVGTVFLLIGLWFAMFILDESLPESQIESQNQLEVPSFMEQLREMTNTAFRKRLHYERGLILLCILITSLFIFGMMADMGIMYLFMRVKFGWSLQKYNIFSSLRDILSIIGTFIGVYWLHKKLKIDEGVVMLMGLISVFDACLVQGLASTDGHIYFAGFLRILSGCVNPMIRSLISKTAKPDEVGKIFSVAVMCQSILQLLGSPVYTDIYNKSLSTWPALYNFVTAGVHFVAIVLTIFLMFMRSKTGKDVEFKKLVDESEGQTCSINDGDTEDPIL